jgi:hypothetical protein
MVEGQDPEYYTSVINRPFSEAVEAQRQEIDQWKSKIVGDKNRPEFVVAGGFV